MADYIGPKEYNAGAGINTYVNPIQQDMDGALIHAVNVESFPFGAKRKRAGYSAFLGTVNSVQTKSLLSYYQNDGTSFWIYQQSGHKFWYSYQGTGDWTVPTNGTVNSTGRIGGAVLDNTFILGDGVVTTRHTTDGTTFIDTPLAPIASQFVQYQNRIYAMGTSSDLFYSTTNDGTNWNTSGTSDSSSFKIPGDGKLQNIFKVADRLIAVKNSGQMYKWDGYNLIDMATIYGPSSPICVDKAEDYTFYVNRYGNYGFGGAKPQLLSNAIQRQFYNAQGSGIAGTEYLSIPAKVHNYDYLASVGTVTDDFTQKTINNCIIKYDYQKNEYLNWDLAHKPTSWLSYKDINGNQTLIFGSSTSQCYKFDGSTSDAGSPINSELLYVFTMGGMTWQKKWNWFRGFFSPGCEAKAQVACSDTFTYQSLKWQNLGDLHDGMIEFRFPEGSRSRFLFLRIYESSTTAKWTYYGCSIDAQVMVQR